MNVWITGGCLIKGTECRLAGEAKPIKLDNKQSPFLKDSKISITNPDGEEASVDKVVIGINGIGFALKDAGLLISDFYRSAALAYSFSAPPAVADCDYYDENITNLILKEAARIYKLKGAHLAVRDSEGIGLTALNAAMILIQSGKYGRIISGWIGKDKENAANSAAFIVMEVSPKDITTQKGMIGFERGEIILNGSKVIKSILDIFE